MILLTDILKQVVSTGYIKSDVKRYVAPLVFKLEHAVMFILTALQTGIINNNSKNKKFIFMIPSYEINLSLSINKAVKFIL
jgi:hypothetical protein